MKDDILFKSEIEELFFDLKQTIDNEIDKYSYFKLYQIIADNFNGNTESILLYIINKIYSSS